MKNVKLLSIALIFGTLIILSSCNDPYDELQDSQEEMQTETVGGEGESTRGD